MSWPATDSNDEQQGDFHQRLRPAPLLQADDRGGV